MGKKVLFALVLILFSSAVFVSSLSEITSRFIQITGKPTAELSFRIPVEGVNFTTPIQNFTWYHDTSFYTNLSTSTTNYHAKELTYSLATVSPFTNISITLNEREGVFTFAPDKWWNGTNQGTFSVTDGSTTVSSDLVTLHVIGNKNPTITSSASTTVTQNAAYTYQMTATDPSDDNDYQETLTFADNTSMFEFNPSSGLIQFTPNDESFIGSHNLKLIVLDGYGGYAEEKFTLVISGANDAPIIKPIGIITLRVAQEQNFEVPVKDPEGDSLTVSTSGTSFITVTGTTLNIHPSVVQDGNYTLVITASDGQLSATETVSLFVLPQTMENTPPEISTYSPSSSNISILEEENMTFAVSGSDGQTNVSIVWYKDDVPMARDTNYTFEGNFSSSGTNAGRYNIIANVSDGEYSTSLQWTLLVNRTVDADNDGVPNYRDNCMLDGTSGSQTDTDGDGLGDLCDNSVGNSCVGNDIDKDGTEDCSDFVRGNASVIDTNAPIFLEINGTSNLSRDFSELMSVRFTKQDSSSDTVTEKTLIEFDYNFTNESFFNLYDISIRESIENGYATLSIHGLNLTTTKTVYLDRFNDTVDDVCIVDQEYASIEVFSNNCDGQDEIQLNCDSVPQGQYNCTFEPTINQYKVEGLNHSSIKQYNITPPGVTPFIISQRNKKSINEGYPEEPAIVESQTPTTPITTITICHLPEKVTIEIPETEWASHEAHDDYRGACTTEEFVSIAPDSLVLKPSSQASSLPIGQAMFAFIRETFKEVNLTTILLIVLGILLVLIVLQKFYARKKKLAPHQKRLKRRKK